MSDFHNVNKVLSLLGTLWSKNYRQSQACYTMVEANLDLLSQVRIDLQELVDCADRHSVPLLHHEDWVQVAIKENAGSLRYPAPKDLVSLTILSNRITSPSLVWHSGIDYTITSGEIIFTADPFDNPLLPVLGDKPEREMLLWGYCGKFDRQYLYNYFGYFLGLCKPTSQNYKDILNALLDVMLHGATMATVEALVNVLAGVPAALTDGEVVEGIYSDNAGWFLATDKNIYRLASAYTVASGMVLRVGEPVIKLVTISKIGNNLEIRTPVSLDKQLLRQYMPPEMLITIIEG